ncbi:MAG: NADP-dependent oxidoreductase [Streptosporangiales bacterium]|nr:NADP-dependent oxidoreductase [Streptosporangiales bacterium]
MSVRSREIHLAARPHGEPTPDDFALVEVELPGPGDGEVLVRNRFFSVDPYMRGRMNDAKSYVPPFAVGEVMSGAAVGEVVESRSDAVSVGDVVLHQDGWREYTVTEAARVRPVDVDAVPSPSAYLGVLGATGFTAYVGLLDIARLRAGDTVFVSGAAGAVGSAAGQLARLHGASRVVGSAGSAEKVAYLVDELGFDAAFDYHDGPVAKQLRDAAPDGIDVYFDNVGGDHLEAAIFAMHDFGRVAACGAISQYNATEPRPGPRNLGMVVQKRLTIRGFIVVDHGDWFADFSRDVGRHVADGSIRYRETFVDGVENAPRAFMDMLRGANIGKMVVRL